MLDSARELNDAPVAGDDATALEERKERREELLRDLVDGAANATSAEGDAATASLPAAIALLEVSAEVSEVDLESHWHAAVYTPRDHRDDD